MLEKISPQFNCRLGSIEKRPPHIPKPQTPEHARRKDIRNADSRP